MRIARCGCWALALQALVLGSACGDGDGDSHGDGGSGDGGDVVAAVCRWQPDAPQLTLPRSEVKGGLRGTSRNASTTCTRSRGTGGPEAIYALRVTERTVVDVEVVSTIDTVVAIRRACDDPLTEVACNDTFDPGQNGGGGTGGVGGTGGSDPKPMVPSTPVPPPPGVADAGVGPGGPPVSATRDGRVRAALDPGTYFVLVDEAEAFGVGGNFVLKVSSSTPPAQSSCPSALPIDDGTFLAAEQLDLAAESPPSCTGGVVRPALFYKATVPSGQRLTVRAQATRGDRNWMPVMQLLSGCSQSAMCLATDRLTSQGDTQLRYVNNGPSEQVVYLAVSASEAVSAAAFQLTVSLGDPIQNSTCQAARELRDGLVLRNQDLSEGAMSSNPACMRFGSTSLFYRATLLQGQRLDVTLTSRSMSNGAPFVTMMSVLDSCGASQCGQQSNNQLSYVNSGPGTRTIFVEVSSFPGLSNAPVFDLSASMPLPQGGVTVQPTSGLVTTEAGGQAVFQVVLTAPPGQPVTIPVRSSDPGEGMISPASLQFDSNNWERPQRVTVTGVDDADRDGVQAFTVILDQANSADPRYQGLDVPDVSVSNRDDEAGFNVEVSGSPITSESGATTSFLVALNRAPTGPVRLSVRSSDEGEGKVAPAELVFEPGDWMISQKVTVTGVDDAERDGNQPYKVLLDPAVSADPAYNGNDPADLDLQNADNEFEKVAAKLISGALSCSFGPPQIAVDDTGLLYVAMGCQAASGEVPPKVDPPLPVRDGGAATDAAAAMPGAGPAMPGRGGGAAPLEPPPFMGPVAFVAVSADGGRTFSAPVNTGQPFFDMRIAGAGSGGAVLALVGNNGLAVSRTDDGGRSWKPPTVLASSGGELKLAAGGSRVVLFSTTGGSPGGLWVSSDSGRSYTRHAAPGAAFSLQPRIDAATGTITVAGFDGELWVRTSTDGGATFSGGVRAPSDLAGTALTLSPRFLFAARKDPIVLIAPLDNPAGSRQVGGLTPVMNFLPVLVADAADNLTLLEGIPEGVAIRRLPAGATAFSAAVPIGPSDTPPGGVALSDRAVAVTMNRSSQIFVAVETWP